MKLNHLTALEQITKKQFAPIALLMLITTACTNPSPDQLLLPLTPPPTDAAITTVIPMVDDLIILDLQESNVVAVSFKVLHDNVFRFDVTLQHDDEGEAPNYADFWQVEDHNGNILGKRILTHSHGNQPFTRSETILLPADVTTVVVRGHDILHGFGGQSMKVNILNGETEAYRE